MNSESRKRTCYFRFTRTLDNEEDEEVSGDCNMWTQCRLNDLVTDLELPRKSCSRVIGVQIAAWKFKWECACDYVLSSGETKSVSKLQSDRCCSFIASDKGHSEPPDTGWMSDLYYSEVELHKFINLTLLSNNSKFQWQKKSEWLESESDRTSVGEK